MSLFTLLSIQYAYINDCQIEIESMLSSLSFIFGCCVKMVIFLYILKSTLYCASERGSCLFSPKFLFTLLT